MKRIGLYLGFPPHSGGAFQYAQAMLEGLSVFPRSEYQVVALYSHPAWKKKLLTYPLVESISVDEGKFSVLLKAALRFGLPMRWWRKIAVSVHSLTIRINKLQCDLWIFPGQEVWTYAIPVQTLGVIHDLMHRYEKQFPEVSAYGLYQRRERHYRYMCRYASGILVDSAMGKQHVSDCYAPERQKIHILPFVAPKYIVTAESGPIPDYPLPAKFIFYPAQFWLHKNHLKLIRAFAKVSHSLTDLHLVLVGSRKNAYGKVKQLIQELDLQNRVHILGYVEERHMSCLYRSARALIMPTFFGPTNIPPLEAMKIGCPVAVSGIYAMPEQLGDAALYFDPHSIDQISETINRLATDDRLCQRLAKAGKMQSKRWTQAHFNQRLQVIVEKMLTHEDTLS